MTIRSVNTAGSAESNVVYTDEAGVEQTATATAGHTTISAAVSAGSDGDIMLLTEDKTYDSPAYIKQMNIYVADNVRHTGVEAADGARVQKSTHSAANNTFICGLRCSVDQCGGLSGDAAQVTYVDCVNVVTVSGRNGFRHCSMRNCVVYVKHSSGVGMQQCESVKNTIILAVGVTPSFGSFSCNNIENTMVLGFSSCYAGTSGTPGGNNMSSNTDAPGTNPYNSVVASAILASVSAGSADAHWKDQATAETYLGSDLSGTFIQDMDRNTRTLWAIGAFGFGGNGGNGAVPQQRNGQGASLGLTMGL